MVQYITTHLQKYTSTQVQEGLSEKHIFNTSLAKCYTVGNTLRFDLTVVLRKGGGEGGAEQNKQNETKVPSLYSINKIVAFVFA